MNKKKPFAPRKREPAELHFFSALDLDTAATRLQDLDTYAVTVERLDENAYGFTIKPSGIRGTSGFVQGTLRRWEGTYTRLDAEGEIQRVAWLDTPLVQMLYPLSGLVVWIGGFLLLALAALLFSELVMMIQHGTPFLITAPIEAFIGGALLVGWIASIFFMAAYMPAKRSRLMLTYINERDTMLSTLKTTFEDAAVLAYSPEDLTTQVNALLIAQQETEQARQHE